ncbi:hypothetical protein [Achromobacter phage Motura]|uniref:Uncharacterized protein n=1 Tax=Achromobacter phage Motura TaxID=2591403 RepID=A0A514CSE6_9CAUD|nr:hypothetical protein H1O15_gp066 [Achromobacter phage Motura]QDH83396.1 hypothetical protein [Achromobacter phage Motura]
MDIYVIVNKRKSVSTLEVSVPAYNHTMYVHRESLPLSRQVASMQTSRGEPQALTLDTVERIRDMQYPDGHIMTLEQLLADDSNDEDDFEDPVAEEAEAECASANPPLWYCRGFKSEEEYEEHQRSLQHRLDRSHAQAWLDHVSPKMDRPIKSVYDVQEEVFASTMQMALERPLVDVQCIIRPVVTYEVEVQKYTTTLADDSASAETSTVTFSELKLAHKFARENSNLDAYGRDHTLNESYKKTLLAVAALNNIMNPRTNDDGEETA